MAKRIDLTGKRFERLVVIKINSIDENSCIRWDCLCDCGNIVIVMGGHLRYGHTKSCGCLQQQMVSEANNKYGAEKYCSEYKIWRGILQRCYSIVYSKYHLYGGRGIVVCNEWKTNYFSFLNDMGRKPSFSHSIDRIDNNKGYYKSNCRWATKKEQAQNRRTNIYLEYGGVILIQEEWARKLKASVKRIHYLLKSGYSFKEIVESTDEKGVINIYKNKTL